MRALARPTDTAGTRSRENRWPGAADAIFAIEAAAVVVCFLVQIPIVLNADLGWLLTVCEKLLAGGKLGVDALELNPPLSWMIYMPAAWLGTVTPIPAHIFVIAMVIAFGLLEIRFALGLLYPLRPDAPERDRAKLVLLFAFLLLPGETFAQREHIAAIALLPFVALNARPAGDAASTAARVLAGLGAGLAMALKPHLALVAGFPMLWKAASNRSLRPLLGLEAWTAGAFVIGYSLLVFVAFPDYVTLYPKIAALVYLPWREPFWLLIRLGMGAALVATLVLLLLTRGTKADGWGGASSWIAAAAGGAGSYLLQAKGFDYNLTAAVTFGATACLLAPSVIGGERAGLRKWPPVRLVALVICVWLLGYSLHEPRLNIRPHITAIEAIAPKHPKLLMISSDVGLGEPLVREVDGTWASAAGSQLAAGFGLRMQAEGKVPPAEAASVASIIRQDRDRLRHDLIRKRPDVLLVDSVNFRRNFDWLAWARSDPVIAADLDAHYRFDRRIGMVSVWVRRKD